MNLFARWAQLALATRKQGEGKLALVIHCEGLVNEKVFRALSAVGKEMEEAKPGLAVITPFCPMYAIDPLKDPERLHPPPLKVDQGALSDFRLKLESLAERFTIGYHGHFFGDDMEAQFDQECGYLKDIGFRPKFYAGGLWVISQRIVERMKAHSIPCDTTINEDHEESLGFPQPVVDFDGIKSLTSIRSPSRWNPDLEGLLATHDYDLAFRERGLVSARFNFKRLVPFAELAA